MSEAYSPAISVDEHTELVLIEIKDAAVLFEMIEANRAYLRKWLTWLDLMTSLADTEKYVKSRIDSAASGEAFCYLIKMGSRCVGVIHLAEVRTLHKKAMISGWVAEEYAGRGLAKKATEALLDHAFRVLLLNRVEIRCSARNLKSQSIPKRLGFVQEAILRDNEWVYDHFESQIVFSLLSHEWSARLA